MITLPVTMFTSWQVPCGIADYAAELVQALNTLDAARVTVVPFDRRPHPRSDYIAWGRQMQTGAVAHIQHEYSFFGYLWPWRNHFSAFAAQIHRPLVITKHVSFDGPLAVVEPGIRGLLRQAKWALYNRWLGPYATYLNRDTFAVADELIVLSRRLRQQLIDRGLESDRITVIPPGVPAVSAVRDDGALRAAWGWSGRRIVGQFGFIAPAKGHRVAVEALRHLPEDYVLLIVGGPRRPAEQPWLDALQQRIDELGLTPRVRITGYLPQSAIPAHLAACDALVYPNTHADFSYSVLVGLAYQTAPPVLSDIVAHQEIAEACAGITLFPNQDAPALAATLRAIIETESHRRELLDHLRAYAQAQSWTTVAQQTLAVYRRAIARHDRT